MGQFFNDLQVCASEKSNSKYLNDVLPYDTVNDIKPYSPQYISGFQAEKYAWRGDACFRLAERMIKERGSQARDSNPCDGLRSGTGPRSSVQLF